MGGEHPNAASMIKVASRPKLRGTWNFKALAEVTFAVSVTSAFVSMPSNLVLSALDIEPAALVVAALIPIVPVDVIVPPVIGAEVAMDVTVPLPPPPPPNSGSAPTL